MAARKKPATRKRSRQTPAPALHIGNMVDRAEATHTLAVLREIALRATDGGREAVAIAAVEKIGALNEVKHVTVSNCSFGMGDAR